MSDIKTKAHIFDLVNNLLNNDFIVHSFNKMVAVRIKFFEVMNQLLMDKFKFNRELMEKLILISYQGLCLEEDKSLLKILQSFLVNTLTYENLPAISNEIFAKNSGLILELLVVKNIKSVDILYIPLLKDQNTKDEILMLYKAFFIDDLEKDKIKVKRAKKLTYLLPIVSLILKNNFKFIDTILDYFKININKSALKLNSKLLHLLMIYYNYLLYVEEDSYINLLIKNDVLMFLSDNGNLNAMTVKIKSENVCKLLAGEMSKLLEFINNFCCSEYKSSLENILKTLQSTRELNIGKLNETLKSVFDSIKNHFSSYVKDCYEIIKQIKGLISIAEKEQELDLLRQKVRVYSSACFYFQQIINKENSSIKISDLTNAIFK